MNVPFNTIFVAVMDTLEKHLPDLPITAAAAITRDLSDKFYDLLESAPIPAPSPDGVEVKDAKADDDRRPLHPFHNFKSLAHFDNTAKKKSDVIFVGDSITGSMDLEHLRELHGLPPTAPGPDADDLDPDHETPPAPIEDGAQDPETLQTTGGGRRMPQTETKADPPEKPLGENALKCLVALLALREKGKNQTSRAGLRNIVKLQGVAYGQALRSLRARGYVIDNADGTIGAIRDLDGNRLDGHPDGVKDERGVTVCPPRYATSYGYEPSPYGR